MQLRTVLILGGRRIEPLVAAREAGLRVVYLGPRQAISARHLELADTVIGVDDVDAARALLDGAHAGLGLDAAVPVVDSHVTLAGDVSETLPSPANPASAYRASHDKARMRTALAGSDLAVSWAGVRTASDARRAIADVGLPGILKPVDGTGSNRIHLISQPQDLPVLPDSPEAGEPEWIYEEFLSGPEYSIETFSADGAHTVLAVTEKFKSAHFVEVGHLVPARIDAHLAGRIGAAAGRVLSAIGFREGLAHTEVIVTDAGVRVVETHVRQGGDAIVELVRLATGTDMQRLLFRWLAGHPVDPAASEHRAAAIWFLTPEPGCVAAVEGEAEAARMPGVTEVVVTVRPGGEIHEPRSSQGRSGFVIAVGAHADEALVRARAAAGVITFPRH
ncbi:ATP-grasp domain-containing protein [Actinoplanes sp. NPDC049118]|uniref:ATP-grasp domain-containing protein n=1 Tax=Actinoplanes sp. NPDC049118 TaxID=3155769 RepID=UPI0033C7A1DA